MAAANTCLVTGATDGIGKQTALELARKGRRVLVHGRNEAKVKAAIDEIHKLAPKAELDAVVGDLSSLAAVRELAQDVNKRIDRLDVLLNNAGIYAQRFERSADGVELTFAINHLAHFQLTHDLWPLLQRSAPA